MDLPNNYKIIKNVISDGIGCFAGCAQPGGAINGKDDDKIINKLQEGIHDIRFFKIVGSNAPSNHQPFKSVELGSSSQRGGFPPLSLIIWPSTQGAYSILG